MKEKSMPIYTEMIVEKLKKNEMSVDELIENIKLPSLSDYLNQMIGKKDITIETLCGLAAISRTTFYRIVNGKMKPSRNLLIRISLVLEISYEETQLLLKCGNCASLSGTRPRDVILINGILHHMDIDQINQKLEEKGYLNLYSRG